MIALGLDSGTPDNQVLTSSIDKLTYLDISNSSIADMTGIQDFVSLTNLNCTGNKLTSLDTSKNTALKNLYCNSNSLTSLNLKNGKNTILTNLNCKSNSTLSCIEVDDLSYSKTNWAASKDAAATYNLSCPTLGLSETGFDKIAVYPNPVNGELHVDNSPLEKATVYDALGKLITKTKFTKSSSNNTINLSGLQSGIYYI